MNHKRYTRKDVLFTIPTTIHITYYTYRTYYMTHTFNAKSNGLHSLINDCINVHYLNELIFLIIFNININ